MSLTLRAFMWSHDGIDSTDSEPIGYEVEGLPGTGRIIIEAITKDEGTIWMIVREGEATISEYDSPAAAKAALERELI